MPTANLGDIAFGVVADVTRLTQALTQIRNFGNAVDQIAVRQQAAGAAMDAMWLRQSQSIINATLQQERFNEALKAADAPQRLLTSNTQAFSKLISDLSGTAAPLTKLDLQRSTQEWTASLAKNKSEFIEWQQSTKAAAVSGGSFVETMEKLARAAQLVTGPLSGAAFRITLVAEMLREGTLGSTLFISGLAGAAYAFTKLGESAIHAERGLLEVRNSLTTLSGSFTQARIDMQFVMATADRFGLQFEQLAKNFAQLDIAARGTRLEGQGVRNMLTQIAAVAGATSMSNEKLTATFTELERLLSMGVVQWRNLRELARDMPNIFELISQTLGTKTVASLQQFLRLGTQTADVVLPKLITVWMKAFGVSAQAPVENLMAAHNRFENALLRFNNALDQTAGFSAGAQRSYNGLRTILDVLTNNMETVRRVFIATASASAGFFGILIAPSLFAGVRLLASAIAGVTSALTGLTVAFAMSPVGLLKLIAGIGLAAIAYFELDKALQTNTKSIITSKVAVDDYIESWDKTKKGLSGVTAAFLATASADKVNIQNEMAGITDSIQQVERNIESLRERMRNARTDISEVMNPETGQKEIVSQSRTLTKALEEQEAELRKLQTALAPYQRQLDQVGAQIQKLTAIEEQQRKIESARTGQQAGEFDALRRKLDANEKLVEKVRELNEEYQAFGQSPYAEQQAVAAAKVAKAVQDLRVSLQDAGNTWDRDKETFTDPKVEQNFERVAFLMGKISEIKLFEKNFIEPWKVARDIIQTGMTMAMDGLISALEKGKAGWKDFGKVAVDILNMIIKRLLEVAVIAPLIDALFGPGTSAVKPLAFGGQAAGGLIGAILQALGGPGGGVLPGGAPLGTGGIGSAHGGTPISSYRFDLSSGLFTGAPRLHSGLAAGEYPAILQRGETVTPKGQQPGGNVVINISNPPGTVAEARRNNVGGQDTYNIIISHIQQGFKRGDLDLPMAGRFGVRPQPVLR